jgi:D-inositol-3-phosphate glycosyltransferase
MRIAVLSTHTCPLASLGGKETGGMNVYVRETSRELARRGVLVHIFTRSQNPSIPRRVSLGEGVDVFHVPAGPERPYPKDLVLEHLAEFVRGVLTMARGPYDLIHSHYWLSGVAGLELRKSWGIPQVHMYHTLARVKNIVARNTAEMEKTPRLNWEMELAREVDALIAPHPLERAQLVWHYQAPPERIHIVPCGVDTSVFHPMDPWEAMKSLGIEGRRWAIFVGRLDPIKGLDILFQAAKILRDHLGPWDVPLGVMIVGGTKAEDGIASSLEVVGLREMARSAGVEDMVIFVGPKSQEELPLYYNAAELCVLPSRYESFGMVALEAMACGTPVVASRVGGLAYTVIHGETGLLVPEGKPEELAQALAILFRERSLRNRLGERAAQRARAFSWRRVVDGLMEVYGRVLGRAEGSGPKRLEAPIAWMGETQRGFSL